MAERRFNEMIFDVPPEIQKELTKYGKSLRYRKQQWLEFLQWFCGSKKFIREFTAPGLGGRFVVNDIDQLRRQLAWANYYAIETKGRITSAFITVNDYDEKGTLYKCRSCSSKVYTDDTYCPKCGKAMRGREAPIYAKVNWKKTLFDFDVHPPKYVEGNIIDTREWAIAGGFEDAFLDAKELSAWLAENGYKNSLVITGGKGCQIWSAYVPNARKIPLLRKLKTLDTTTINDQAQVARIPYTLHPKTYLFCLPFSQRDEFYGVLKRAQKCPIMPLRYDFNGR